MVKLYCASHAATNAHILSRFQGTPSLSSPSLVKGSEFSTFHESQWALWVSKAQQVLLLFPQLRRSYSSCAEIETKICAEENL